MKKLLLSALLLSIISIAKAQITLEHTYLEDQIDFHYITDGSVVYSTFNNDSGILKIYSENHSLIKEITVPPLSGYKIKRPPYLISDKLFNTDSGFEYCIEFAKADGSEGEQVFRIQDESGTPMLTTTKFYTPDVELIKTPTGMKLFLNFYSGFNNGNNYEGKIYSLPGSIPLSAKGEANISASPLPFPNPASSQIAIPYNLTGNAKASIQIIDTSGKLMESFTVDSTFDHLLLNTSAYSNGVYFYKIVSQGAPVSTKRFIVNR